MGGNLKRPAAEAEAPPVATEQIQPPAKRSRAQIERGIEELQRKRIVQGGMIHPAKEAERMVQLEELYLERAEADLKECKQKLRDIRQTTITVFPDRLFFKPYAREEDDCERAKECVIFDYDYRAFPSSNRSDCFSFNETVEFYRELKRLMATSSKIVVYGDKTTTERHHERYIEFRVRDLAVFLSILRMKELGMDASAAFEPFSTIELPPFTNDPVEYHHTYRSTIFELSGLDICRSVEKGMKLGWIDFESHDLATAKDVQKRLLMNRITPHFYALATPRSSMDNSPKQHLPFFQSRNIKVLVKLTEPDEKHYDPKDFEDGGVKVMDLSFEDGGLPTKEHVNRFLTLADDHVERNEAVAVHCAMGWGRTGVLICAALISRHGFTAREAIGYIRFMRWQTVQQLQQPFLERIEKDLQEHRFLTKEAPKVEDFPRNGFGW